MPLRPLGILRHRRFVFLSSADAPKQEVPYSLDFACFKKYLDRVAVVMVNSPMLARHLDHPPRRKSFPCILLQPLCALFSSAALSFQSLAASFPKTPGWGYLRAASAPAAPARPAGGSRRYHLPLLLSPISSRLSPLSDRSSMLFRINTCKSVSKQTTLTSFRINTYEKRGGGGTRGKRTLPLTPRQPSLFCLLSGRCLSPVR